MSTQKQTYAERMVFIASNYAELKFTRKAHRLFDKDGNLHCTDAQIVQMLKESFLDGALQATTDKDDWLNLMETIQDMDI